MSESQKKRILWIDIAKGIAILLMVIGHVDNIHPYLKGIIFSFHMPLFMIINGYLIRSYDIKKTFIRSLRTLMLPYFVVCLLQAAISTILAAGSGTELEVLQYRLISMLFGMSKSSTILTSVGGVSLIWFLTSLFLARNIYVILRSLLNLLPADENDRAEILRLLSSRSIHGLSELFRRRGFDTAVFDTLLALLGLECSLSELPNRLRSLAGDRLEESVLQELDELAALAEGDDCRARFDISVLNDPHYYNGLVFRGYARGAADKVLSGGRYDRLVRRMGRSGGAVGFAVYLAFCTSNLHRKLVASV